MDPATLGVLGVMTVSSLAQAYNSHKARGAAKKELDKLEALFEKIKPPDYDLSISDPPELHGEMLKLPEFSGPLAAPKFDLSKLTPEEYKMVGQYSPEAADFIKEAAPQTIQKSEGMKTGREAQLNALRRFMEVGEGGYDPEYQEAVTRAGRQAQSEAQSRQQSLMQDYARRGQAGSGVQLAAQLGAGAQAMDRGAMANLSAATQAYRNRLDALSRGAELGGQIGQQDLGLQQANTNIINSFNQRMTAARQDWENQRANLANVAELRNLDLAQSLENQNVGGRNQAAVADRNRLDELSKFGYNAAVGQQGRQDQLGQWRYGAQVQGQQYGNQIAQQKYQNTVGQQDRLNRLKSQGYEDLLAKARGQSGISEARSSQAMQGAQDINNLLQGLSNVAGVYGTSQAAKAGAQGSDMSRMNAAKMEKTGSFMTPEEMEEYRKMQAQYY